AGGNPNFDPARLIMSPGARKEVLHERRKNDVVTLKPHTNVNKHGHDKGNEDIAAYPLRPPYEWKDTVTEHHSPEVERIRTRRAFGEDCPLINVTAIPCDKELDAIGISNNRRSKKR